MAAAAARAHARAWDVRVKMASVLLFSCQQNENDIVTRDVDEVAVLLWKQIDAARVKCDKMADACKQTKMADVWTDDGKIGGRRCGYDEMNKRNDVIVESERIWRPSKHSVEADGGIHRTLETRTQNLDDDHPSSDARSR